MWIDYVKLEKPTPSVQAIAQWAQQLLPPSWHPGPHHHTDSAITWLGRMLLFRRLTQLGYTFGDLPEMAHTTHGKPYLTGLDLHFSLSHSQGILLLAVSDDQPVGIDVETLRPIAWRNYESYFSAAEWLDITASPHPSRQLIERWVIKEAAHKLNGQRTQPIGQKSIKTRRFVKRAYVGGQRFYYRPIDELPQRFIARLVTKQKVRNLDIQNLTHEVASERLLYIVRA